MRAQGGQYRQGIARMRAYTPYRMLPSLLCSSMHVVPCRCLVVASSPRHRPAERAAAGAATRAARQRPYLQDEHLHLLDLVVDICGVHGGCWDGRHTDGPTAALTHAGADKAAGSKQQQRSAASHFDLKPTNATQRDTSRRTTQYDGPIMERPLVKFRGGISLTARRRALQFIGCESTQRAGSSVLPCNLACRVSQERSRGRPLLVASFSSWLCVLDCSSRWCE